MADSDLINDELERVYRLYGDRTRQFRRTLYGLIVVGLAIFVLLVVPFLTFRDQLAEMQRRASDLAIALQEARDLTADTRTGMKQMREIRDAVDAFSQTYTELGLYREMEEEAAEHGRALEDLRQSFAGWQEEGMEAWVRGAADRPPAALISTNRQLFGLNQRACYWESGVKHVSCRLCDDFTREHRHFAGRISRLPATGESLRAAARDDLQALTERACGWLTRDAAHWRTGERFTSTDPVDLRGWFAYDLRDYLERVAALETALRQTLPERELEVERIQRMGAVTTQRLAVLEVQLGRIASFDRLGTPAGDLPIGLGQIVLLFPVVLAFGFLVVANSHARTTELQRAFVRLCRKRDAEGAVMDARHIAAIAPLWLDRREPLGAQAVKWAILLTPLALTLANLLLIVTTAALTAQLPDDAAIPPAGYLVLYAASLALFAGTLWYIWHSGREPAPVEDAGVGTGET